MPSPWANGGPVILTWTAQPDRAKLHLIHTYEERRNDGSVFELHGILLADPKGDGYIWIAVDSNAYSPLPPSTGTWEGSLLRLTKTTLRGIGTIMLTLAGDTLDWEVGFAPTLGDYAPILQGRLTRMAPEV